jgi:hypothetical protein
VTIYFIAADVGRKKIRIYNIRWVLEQNLNERTTQNKAELVFARGRGARAAAVPGTH